MKKLSLLIALLLALQSYVYSQTSVSFLINIMDENEIISITENGEQLQVTFKETAINNILDNYEIYTFERAYPSARLASNLRVWRVEVNDIQLMTDLLTVNQNLFPLASEENTPVFLYDPNDYGLAPQLNGQKDLDLIRAKQAWDITKGDPSIVIGVTDNGFDVQHEDLVNQIVQVRTGAYNNASHGTNVAGALGAETDNNKGIASIGFNCKLDVSKSGLGNVLQMSVDGRKVINSSWYNTCSPTFGSWERTCNEVYENGALAVWGAGNGFKIEADNNGVKHLVRNHCEQGPVYPAASSAHNIIVSSVGSDIDYGLKSWWPGLTDSIEYNWKDVHENVIGKYDTMHVGGAGDGSGTYYPAGTILQTEVHNHYNDVDITAPGYLVRVTTLNNGYSRKGNGTSFAAPLVSGTAGLMLSTNNCLTPYQLEYGLKTTAVNIYNIPENQQYAGQLGAGRLDAGAAVSWADNHDCNSLFTTTMHIEGIELNTICRPGQSSNGVNPILTPQIVNGTPPYTYQWEPLAGNEATLSATNVANPEVTASTGSHQLKYYLTVYDNSQVQKVASKQIEIQLSSNNTYDLAMQDSYMDMLNEANDQIALDPREWNIWQSPDVWNRQTQDGVEEHENPEYFTTLPNYAYAKVRNIGCAASPTTGMKLRLYWTIASTGENWDTDWTTATVIGTGGATVDAGGEITNTPIAIPSIQPGGEHIVNHEWYPVEPEAYDPQLNSVDVCFLARLTESGISPYGMTTPEVVSIKQNVLNNNNIVTRNFILTNFKPGDFQRHQIYVGNVDENAAQSFDLQLINERDINPHFSGDISSAGTIVLHLGNLYDRWVANGANGTYGSIDEGNRTVSYDGSVPVLLEDIDFDPGERVPILVEFVGNSEYQSPMPFRVHLRQFEHGVEYSVPYGNVSFEIEPNTTKSQSKSKSKDVVASNHYMVYPNPTSNRLKIHYIGTKTNNQISINVYDLSGKLILEQNNRNLGSSEIIDLEVSQLAQGMYILRFIDQDGESEQIKFVKE